MLRRVVLVRTVVSEEISAYFIKVTGIGELGTTLAVTINRRTLRRNTKCLPQRRIVIAFELTPHNRVRCNASFILIFQKPVISTNFMEKGNYLMKACI
jgi:hypothetical protein